MIRHLYVPLQLLTWFGGDHPPIRRVFITLAAFFCCLPSIAAAQGGFPSFGPQGEQPSALVNRAKQREAGRKLFLRNWLKEGRLNTTGDGLGPMYNDVSCVACHKDGGSAMNDKNVDLLSLRRPPMRSSKPLRFPQAFIDRAAKKIHPNFNPDANRPKHETRSIGAFFRSPNRSRTSFTLHKIRGQDRNERSRYARLRELILWKKNESGPYSSRQIIKRMNGVTIEITQRNTPALFGSGLIDIVPVTLIINTAKQQRKLHRGVTGRVAQTPSGQVGRFGWRGQTATLHDFVLGACANELGLAVPNTPQPNTLEWNKREKRWESKLLSEMGNRLSDGNRLDLTEKQCESLTSYVASLPAPHQVTKLSLPLAKEVARGEKLFEKAGCAVCHVPDMKPAFGIYSDLLLHDMGPKLSDPLAAIPKIDSKTAPGFTGASGYYGSEALPQIAKITTNVMQEWRTPPLWGVADSAPYMHDGRAQTLDEAIRWHGGEARGSLRKYKRLSKLDRRRVVMFLESLVAPGSISIPRGLNAPLGAGFSGGGRGFFSVVP